MRRRLQKYLPIILIALMVQILAPVVACWAAAVAASDPLNTAQICHDNVSGVPGQTGDQGGDPRAHEGACAICCVAQASASLDAPQAIAAAAPHRTGAPVVWQDQASGLARPSVGSNAQARAPPLSV